MLAAKADDDRLVPVQQVSRRQQGIERLQHDLGTVRVLD